MKTRLVMCLLVAVGVVAGNASAAGKYLPIRTVYITRVVQSPHTPVRIVIAFELAPRASLKQHLLVSYKIWDAHGRVVYYAGASTASTPRRHHGQITLRWNRRGLDRLLAKTERSYVVRPFAVAYPLDENTHGNRWQFLGGRLTGFVLR
jgi:hypothetical protein